MSPGENKLIAFIAIRLESMLRRPAVWGSNLSVEEQVLQLLEIRRLLLDPATDVDSDHLMQRYTHFIAEEIPEATPEPLALQLELRGRDVEFTTILKRFVKRELEWVVEAHQTAAQELHDRAEAEIQPQVESTRRIFEWLRAEAIAEATAQARINKRVKSMAIDFNIGRT